MEMGDLVNLRHLDIRGCQLQWLPPRMGRLKDLRTLPYFFVSKDSGCGIMELKSLSNLQWDLRISRLENVDNDDDAKYANLKDKKFLNKLELEWSSSFDDMQETGVLDALKPHRNLKELSIKHYSGKTFPIWIGNPHSNLMVVSISDCHNCPSLPPLGQLPSLRKLIIEGMDIVRRIDSEFYRGDCCAARPFPSLEILKFRDMPLWEEWLSPDVGEFPCLRELCIDNCPKLKQMLGSVASLKILNIHHCKELPYIPCLPQIQILVLKECDQVILGSVANLTSLEMLHLLKLLKLQCLPQELLHRLTGLHVLKVDNCDELTILSSQDGLVPQELQCLEIVDCKNLEKLPQGLYSLQTLKIINCPSLAALPEMDTSSNLRNLHIINCEALEFLPEGLMRNKDLSVEVLEISDCFSFKCFPNGELPLTLRRLKISNCPALNFLPAGLQDKNICLESLQIIKCSLITSFPTTSSSLLPSTSGSSPSSSSNSTSRLKELEINDCMELVSLPDGLHSFVNLDKLLISSCPKLVSFPAGGLPPNLVSLSISKCETLQALPYQMHNLTSLVELHVSECSSLESFPEGGLPASLKSLCVKKCKNLNSPSKWHLDELESIMKFDISNE